MNASRVSSLRAGARAGVTSLSAAAACAFSQGLPPIYDHTASKPAPTSIVAEFDKGTFLENLAIGPDGVLHVNSYLDGKVYRIGPDGQPRVWCTVDGTIAGIALNPDGSALLSGWIKGKEPAVFAVDPAGRSSVLLRLPDAQFPNGVVRLAPDQYLVADSYKGVIWRVDAKSRTAAIWLQDDSLARSSADNPTPAVNGLKLHGGALYASNTARQWLLKVPVTDGKAGRPEVLRTGFGIDDFDFDDSGVLYGATHVYNSLVRLGVDGSVTIIAGLEQGMAGSTAVAYSQADGGKIYVTTNGGLSLPPAGGVQRGKVVRVAVGAAR